jgi:hypothetical protein
MKGFLFIEVLQHSRCVNIFFTFFMQFKNQNKCCVHFCCVKTNYNFFVRETFLRTSIHMLEQKHRTSIHMLAHTHEQKKLIERNRVTLSLFIHFWKTLFFFLSFRSVSFRFLAFDFWIFSIFPFRFVSFSNSVIFFRFVSQIFSFRFWALDFSFCFSNPGFIDDILWHKYTKLQVLCSALIFLLLYFSFFEIF